MDLTVTFPGNSRVNAEFEGFVVPTDQDAEDGGEGSAPTPFSLFLASLGACAGIYVLHFLQHRAIPTENLRMTMATEADRSRGMLRKISFTIGLPESFPDKYVAALIRAVDHCTVKRHLHDPPTFETTVMIGERVARVAQS